MGAGNAPDRRSGRDASTGARKGAGGCQGADGLRWPPGFPCRGTPSFRAADQHPPAQHDYVNELVFSAPIPTDRSAHGFRLTDLAFGKEGQSDSPLWTCIGVFPVKAPSDHAIDRRQDRCRWVLIVLSWIPEPSGRSPGDSAMRNRSRPPANVVDGRGNGLVPRGYGCPLPSPCPSLPGCARPRSTTACSRRGRRRSPSTTTCCCR